MCQNDEVKRDFSGQHGKVKLSVFVYEKQTTIGGQEHKEYWKALTETPDRKSHY